MKPGKGKPGAKSAPMVKRQRVVKPAKAAKPARAELTAEALRGAIVDAVSESATPLTLKDLYRVGGKNQAVAVAEMAHSLAKDGTFDLADVEGRFLYSLSRKSRADIAGRTRLGLAVIRVLGEAHEPLPVETLLGKLSKAIRPPLVELSRLLADLCPVYVENAGKGWITAPVAQAGSNALPRAEKPARDPAPPVDAEAPTERPAIRPSPTAEEELQRALAAGTQRKVERVVYSLSVDERKGVDAERSVAMSELDTLAKRKGVLSKRVRACSRQLVDGARKLTVETLTVPCLVTSRLVTFDVSASPPRRIREKKLPAKYTQAKLPFPDDVTTPQRRERKLPATSAVQS